MKYKPLLTLLFFYAIIRFLTVYFPTVPRSMLSPDDSSNKRNSASFNMAAKGWGTYAKFYTPVTFAT